MRFPAFPFVLGPVAALALCAVPVRAQVKAGAEFRANTYVTSTQDNAAVGVFPNGDFIIAWESSGGQDGSGDGVFAQRYNRDGTPRGGEFQVNTYTTEFQNRVDVAVNKKGNFVMVWRAFGEDGSSYGIFGQRFASSGARAGAEFQVNTITVGSQIYPGVGMDAAGNFMVVWDSANADGNSTGVRAQRYDASGSPVGGEFGVNTYTTGAQDTPKIAMAPDGRSVVVWESPQDGASDGVYGQRYDAAGNPAGGEFQVNTSTTGFQGDASVGMTPDGRFVVAWEDSSIAVNGQDVRTQSYDASGNPVGAEFLANTYTAGSQFLYAIAIDYQGNYVLVWDDFLRDGSSYGEFGYRYTYPAARRGAEFQANTYTSGYQGVSALNADEVGNYVVSWHSDQDPSAGGRGVYAQRFGGLFSTALAVDTTGNRVWEPGETVDVRPTWQNFSGASQAFGGTLSGITGPAGGVYTITDTSGDYGTVPDGAAAACTDCYGVMVDDPATRPAQHWDASALESITPDTQGQQKRWTLHIGRSFTDVPTSNGFYRFIETLLHHSITGGCGGTSYCPSSSISREQIAVFVLVAKEGAGFTPPACTTPVFTDVPASSPFCRFIEELFRRGVVVGCGGGSYCPADPVTREQIAVFLLRTLDPALSPPACTTPVFADVPASSPFCKWIEELARRGVVTGCGGGNYCPNDPVTREQMGVFLTVTFGLALYGP